MSWQLSQNRCARTAGFSQKDSHGVKRIGRSSSSTSGALAGLPGSSSQTLLLCKLPLAFLLAFGWNLLPCLLSREPFLGLVLSIVHITAP